MHIIESFLTESKMQYIKFMWMVFLVHCSLCSCYDDSIICVYEQENSCQGCTVNYSNVSSIEFPDSGGFTLRFCSEEFKLEGDISIISNKQSVLVRGMPTMMKCERNLMENVGLLFDDINDLVIQDIHFEGCSALHNVPQSMNGTLSVFRTSLYILNCTNVTVQRVTIANSTGNGLTMFNNDGTISIENCTFEGNEGNNYSNFTEKSGGIGLYIDISYCGPRKYTKNSRCPFNGRNIQHSNHSIKGCKFLKNRAGYIGNRTEFPEILESETLIQGFGRGGGLCVVIDSGSSNNLVEVNNCSFVGNSGTWGGGLYLAIQEDSGSNQVIIKNSNFYQNDCSNHAGGGVNLGYTSSHENPPQNNSISFENCTFAENRAQFGGGSGVYSTPLNNLLNSTLLNRISFTRCNWTRNAAETGAALAISHLIWSSSCFDRYTQISFSDCTFKSNHLTGRVHSTERYVSQGRGKGTFTAVGYHLYFDGSITFHNNTDSAMYLTSTHIEFKQGSRVIFDSNSGFEGGAIFLLGSSSIIVNDDSVFQFMNNRATDSGGAIFQYTFDKNDFISSLRCFIKYNGRKDLTERNIKFLFENNSAGPFGRNTTKLARFGHSIFAVTLGPCQKFTTGCELSTSYDKIFECIGNFTFIDGNAYDISTSGREIGLTNGHRYIQWVIPGKLIELPIESLNDLSREVSTVLHVSVKNLNGSNVLIDSAYTYTSNKMLRVFGKHGDRANIVLETTGIREIVFKLQVNIQQCPPGYVHNHEEDNGQCVCSASTEGKFAGIQFCDDKNFRAMLFRGYWMGYDRESKNSRFGKEENLLFSYCPRGQCKLKLNKTYSLPNTTSIKDLENLICGSSRKGVLCSLCRENFTAHYHNDVYECKEAVDDCKWGWLFYILSEIIPVTILFILVLLSDITLTDGAINGFIFFVQVTDTMLIRGSSFIKFPIHTEYALEAYQLITRVFNLNFFAHNKLSFCLWKSATTPDMLAFKYVTILYSLLLVTSIIFISKYCNFQCVRRILKKASSSENAASAKGTIIHGISGFLILCYSECVRISLLLLTPVDLSVSNVTGTFIKRRVVFYSGELIFFSGKHLSYALPALFILTVFCIVPVLFLLSYPLCYKVFALLRISESRMIKLLCTCIPLEKFKPFFDSFQGSFKDECRFFSGLYFIYRFITLLIFAFSSELTTFYILVQIQFVIILAIHAIASPYKNYKHNILDSLLFLNLATINLISLLNFHFTLHFLDKQQYIDIASSLQIVLLYLPLVYIIVYASKKIVQRIKCRKLPLPRRKPNDYRKYSVSLSLSAAESRMLDTVDY